MLAMIASLWAILQVYRQWIGIAVIFFGPRLFAQAQMLLRNRNTPRAPLSTVVWAIIAAHAAYTVYALALPPYDVFVTHGLKIQTPTYIIRPVVLRSAGVTDDSDLAATHPLLDLLLTRLGTVEGRYQYARWGHEVFTRCVWCKSKSDLSLAALPSIATPYVFEAILVGVLGWNWVYGSAAATDRARQFRPMVGWILSGLLAADYLLRWFWDVRAGINGDCDHLAVMLYKIRTVALFLVTLGYLYMPFPQNARSEDVALLNSLNSSMKTQKLTALARVAITRSPAMSRLNAEHRATLVRQEERARADPDVIAAAQSVGLLEGTNHARGPRERSRGWIMGEWKRLVKLPGDAH